MVNRVVGWWRGRRPRCGSAMLVLAAGVLLPPRVAAQVPVEQIGSDSVKVRFVDTDLRAMIQALGAYLPKPVITANLPSVRASLETPRPVATRTLGALFKGLVESHGLEYLEDSSYIRVSPKAQASLPSPGSGPAQAPIQLFVIRLKHARAADVAATVNSLFGGGGAFSGSSGLNGTLSDELRRNAIAPFEAPAAPGQPGAPPGAPPPAGSLRQSALSGSVVIVPDLLTNSLLVRANQQDHEVLKQAVEQLDIRPLQVLIEVLIVEARRDRSFSLGADLLVPQQKLDGNASAGGTLTGGGLGDLVIRLLNLGKGDVDAVIRTAQSRGQVDIVSRPVLIASNNTEARFLVGSQRPFVQVSRVQPTDGATRDQVVQYRDVGTKLMVRPTINQDGYVSLLIQQEISAATSETQFDAPVISTREAVTQVLVKDGQTIMLGGLSDRQRDRQQSGIPILSGIPIIGGLFGSANRRSTSTELYLFLTPRILRSDEDVDRVTSERLPAAEGAAP